MDTPSISTTKRGWAGEELEIAHQRQQIRTANAAAAAAAPHQQRYQTVNLDQFQNKEVGVGYQARGVIRQRTGRDNDAPMKIIDMSKKRATVPRSDGDAPLASDSSSSDASDASSRSSGGDRRRRKKRKKRKKWRTRSEKESGSKVDPMDEFIKCKALRDFRKELEKILSEGK